MSGFGAYGELAFGEATVFAVSGVTAQFNAVATFQTVATRTIGRATLFSAVGALSTEATVGVIHSRSTGFAALGGFATEAFRTINAQAAFNATGEMRAHGVRIIPFYTYPIGRHLWNDYGKRASAVRYRGGRF